MGEDEVDVDEGVAEDEVDHGDDHEDCCSKSGQILFFILFLFCPFPLCCFDTFNYYFVYYLMTE